MAACEKGHKDVVLLLLENRASVHAINQLGSNCAIFASVGGQLDLCQLLAERKANFCIIRPDKMTALHFAARSGSVDTVQFAIEQKCSVTSSDEDGAQPIHESVVHLPTMKYLV